MAMRVCVTETFAEQYGRRIRSLSPDLEVVRLLDDGGLDPEVDRVDVFYLSDDLFGRKPPMRRMLALVKQGAIGWFHTSSAGIDYFIFQRVLDSGATLSHSPRLHSRPIAEYVISAMLQEVKQVRSHYEAQQRHEWAPIMSDELAGKTVGIVGLGGIGQAVARRAKAFEMRVIGTKRSPLDDPNVDELLAPDRLGELLAASDFVVLTAPLTDETRGLIGAAELAQMRPQAVLINVARGEIVDEAALIAALQAGGSGASEGGIAAAYLDVTEVEPLPYGSPLWGLPNCTLTPHDSDTSPQGHSRTAEHFLKNLARYVRDEPLEDVVESTGITFPPR